MTASPAPGVVYQQLYDAHAGAVLAYLSNKLRDPDVAEDVAQDAWLRAHRFLPDVLAKGRAFQGKAWLMTVATSAMLDHFRRVKARPQTSGLDDALAPGAGVPAALTDDETPEGAVLAEGECDAQRAAAALLMELLPHSYRLVVWLYEWRGYDYEQMAVALKTTTAGVKSRLYRAREAQRVLWERSVERERSGITGSGSVESRLWRYVGGGRTWALAHRDACWLWCASANGTGSPLLNVHTHAAARGPAGGTQPKHAISARRLVYAVCRGPIPPWVRLLRCAHGAGCVNPWHLRPATTSPDAGGATGPVAGRTTYHLVDPGIDAPQAGPENGVGLRGRRLRLAVTLPALAGAAGVNKDTVIELEKGRLVTPATARRVERALAALESRLAPVPDTGTGFRSRRLSLGVPVQEAARLAGVYRGTISSFELGRTRPKANVLRRLQDALDRLERERPQGSPQRERMAS